jgi:hypothetical protein
VRHSQRTTDARLTHQCPGQWWCSSVRRSHFYYRDRPLTHHYENPSTDDRVSCKFYWRTTVAPTARGGFGYRDDSGGWTRYCAEHRIGQWYTDARHDDSDGDSRAERTPPVTPAED